MAEKERGDPSENNGGRLQGTGKDCLGLQNMFRFNSLDLIARELFVRWVRTRKPLWARIFEMADEFVFEVVSASTGEIYNVRIVRDGGNLLCTCTCPAGKKGTVCKHRLGVMSGSDEGVTGGDVEAIGRMSALLEGTEVEKALNSLSALELEMGALKKQIAATKRNLGRILEG